MRKVRLVLAFLAAAATAALVLPLTFCAAFLAGLTPGSCREAINGFSWYAFPITVPASVMLGAPLLLVFNHFQWLRWWQVAFGGAFIGLVAALILPLTSSGFVWYTLGLFSVPLGFLAGLVFWLVGVFRNPGPNNSFKPKPLRGSA